MTHRYAPLVEAAQCDGLQPTARARTHPEVKGGTTFWRVKVRTLPTPQADAVNTYRGVSPSRPLVFAVTERRGLRDGITSV